MEGATGVGELLTTEEFIVLDGLSPCEDNGYTAYSNAHCTLGLSERHT